MATSSRYEPAIGKKKDLSGITKQYSARDLPSQTKLKYREPGQGGADDLRNKDYRKDLEDRERLRKEKESKGSFESLKTVQPPAKKSKNDATNLDADDPVDDSENDSSSESEDEDDTAALMAELQRIKKERAAEVAKKEVEKKAEEERIRAENILSGNPLLNYTGPAAAAPQPKSDMKVKRRWNEDVVFKNCARADDTKGKAFINDCLRSEFHRKFMEKYIK